MYYFYNRSCVGRESFKAFQAGDLSWLTDTPVVFLNIGQYVNNHNAGNNYSVCQIIQIIHLNYFISNQ